MTAAKDYIVDMCGQLSKIAQAEGMPFVAYLLELSAEASSEATIDRGMSSAGGEKPSSGNVTH